LEKEDKRHFFFKYDFFSLSFAVYFVFNFVFPFFVSCLNNFFFFFKFEISCVVLKRFLLLFLIVFSTIFSFKKLICNFWQIVRHRSFS